MARAGGKWSCCYKGSECYTQVCVPVGHCGLFFDKVAGPHFGGPYSRY